jgi:AcrR family transcriptional regulator
MVNVPERDGRPARQGTRLVGRPRGDEGLDTRADLMRVGRELFAARGYAGTSVSDIGARADVTVPVIYQRFGSKAGLFVAVAEDVYGEGLTMLRDALATSETFDEAVEATLLTMTKMYRSDRWVGTMVVTVLLEAERDEELGRALRPTLRLLREYCDEVAKLAPPDLAADEGARRDLSRALVALFSGVMLSSVLLHRAPEYERMVAAVARVLAGHRA